MTLTIRLTSVAAGLVLGALTLFAGSATAGPPSDASITDAVQHELAHEEIVPFNRIDVITQDGIVTLTGSVSTLAARNQAERRTSIVRGVRSIINHIKVDATRPASDIQSDVRGALADDPATDAYEVHVQSNPDGVITLTGAVDSWAEKKLAGTVATTVPGVAAVANELTVESAPAFGGGDGELAEVIRGRLRWDARVNDSLIRVIAMDGGRVLISGTVGSLAEKRLATELAHVQGAQSINATHLDVKPWANDDELRRGVRPPVADKDVRAAVVQTLKFDPRVLSTPIDVRVEKGTVWLDGAVDNLLSKRSAKRDAENTVGVGRVVNYLKVRPMVLSDSAIADLITNSLRGRGLLDDNEIHVTVKDRRARLTGDVGDSFEYWQIDALASRARGLEELENDVTVRGRTPLAGEYPYSIYPKTYYMPDVPHDYRVPTDREIYDSVASELFWSPFVDSDAVSIDVEDGVVTLSGKVGSRRERELAADNAVEGGALAVDNELTIMN